MKFQITKEAFLDGLQKVQHVVSSRSTLPILSNVLIESKGDQLVLTTTDLDVGVSVTIAAEVSKEGATTLPVRRLVSIIRELPASVIDVDIDGKDVASIRSGPSFFKIIGLPRAEFPPLPSFTEAKEYKINQKALREGLKKTSYAISNDETRYVLNGIFVAFLEGKLTLVATDGRRLAMVENDLEFPASHETDLIMPTKAVQELQRMLSGEGDIQLKLSDNQLSFEHEGSIIVSKLIEGNYPNYKQVIPSDSTETITVSRETLLETVRRVSILSSDKSNSVKFTFEAGAISIMADSPDIGEAKESIPVNYSGKEFSIAFNPDFLMDPLKNLDDEEVYLDLIDEMSPGVIRGSGKFLYVIMPMRIAS